MTTRVLAESTVTDPETAVAESVRILRALGQVGCPVLLHGAQEAGARPVLEYALRTKQDTRIGFEDVLQRPDGWPDIHRPRGGRAHGQRGADEIVVSGGEPAVGTLEHVFEADSGVPAWCAARTPAPARHRPPRRAGAPGIPTCPPARAGSGPTSATAVSGSVTVDSASTRVVIRGMPLRLSVTASPLVQTPSSTPMPTDAAALQISTQPSSCTFTEQT